ncbi:MAG: NADH-quinone oxidoreductase subunit C [Micropruina sp.]|nr:MAG: NADH-quinone oxidoreductase subunit C [Micropruina sp.]
MTDTERTVAPDQWRAAASAAIEDSYAQFDWLGVVDEIGRRPVFRVVCRLVDPADPRRAVRLNAEVDRDDPVIDSLGDVFGGATWHEREAHDFFGVRFGGGDDRPLLLRAEYTGFPLRKDEVLGARAARPWPGAKEPGEAGAAGRRRMVPQGVPDPEVWGDRQGAPAAPDEVAGSAVGGRVRRRR